MSEADREEGTHPEEEGTLGVGHILFTVGIGVLLVLYWRGVLTTVFRIDVGILLALVGGHRIFIGAIRGLFRREISADLAVAIAAAAALILGSISRPPDRSMYLAAAEVIFIMLVGEALEVFAVGRTRVSIRRLIALSPKKARVRRDGQEVEVAAEEVRPGEVVIVRPGERIPVDGVVVDGSSSVNQSTITGESVPAEKHPGDEVFTGTVNELGALDVRATRVGEDTTLAKVIHLVERARERKAPVQRLADRYATYFVPVVIGAALVTFLVTKDIIRAVSVLIIACPCALVLATPTAIVAGIGRLARDGILVKGGVHLEQVARCDRFVFDKTGTLTEGAATLAAVVPFGDATERVVLQLAAAAEQRSEHVIGQLIVAAARQRGLTVPESVEFSVLPGLGVRADVGGIPVVIGSRRLLERDGVQLTAEASAAIAAQEEHGRTVILVAAGGAVRGAIAIEDRPRAGARQTVSRLRELGMRSVSLLTGDNERVAAAVAQQVGIEQYAADLLPEGKVAQIEQWESAGDKVAMLGDGVNDAPALVAADVGIAMGVAGTDVTVEAADIVLMADELPRAADLIELAKRTLRTIRQNILYFAILLNLAAVIAASTGLLSALVAWLKGLLYGAPTLEMPGTPAVAAAVVHQVSSLLVVCNSLRLLGARPRGTGWGPRALQWWRLRADRAREVLGTPPLARCFDWGHHWLWVRRHRGPLGRWGAAALVAIYALSGLYSIQPGERGIVRQFGRMIASDVRPGLHYRVPWPIERLTRVPVERVRVVEIGFRSQSVGGGIVEPPSYEWNVQHRFGRYVKVPEEAVLFTGDENLCELTCAVQYRVTDPGPYLFAAAAPDEIMRAASEAAVRSVVGTARLDDVFTLRRRAIEEAIRARAQAASDAYGTGIEVLSARLQDVHPPLEVVDAFRDVSSAEEEKSKMVNEAEAYAKDLVPRARGTAAADVRSAQAYALAQPTRARGDADRFVRSAAAYRRAPNVTATRLYLETAEETLADLSKVILDGRGGGRRQMLMLEAGGVRVVPTETLGPVPLPAPAEQAEPMPQPEATQLAPAPAPTGEEPAVPSP